MKCFLHFGFFVVEIIVTDLLLKHNYCVEFLPRMHWLYSCKEPYRFYLSSLQLVLSAVWRPRKSNWWFIIVQFLLFLLCHQLRRSWRGMLLLDRLSVHSSRLSYQQDISKSVRARALLYGMMIGDDREYVTWLLLLTNSEIFCRSYGQTYNKEHSVLKTHLGFYFSRGHWSHFCILENRVPLGGTLQCKVIAVYCTFTMHENKYIKVDLGNKEHINEGKSESRFHWSWK